MLFFYFIGIINVGGENMKYECLFCFGIVPKKINIIGLQQARDYNSKDRTISIDTITELDINSHCLFPISHFKSENLDEIKDIAYKQIDKLIEELKRYAG